MKVWQNPLSNNMKKVNCKDCVFKGKNRKSKKEFGDPKIFKCLSHNIWVQWPENHSCVRFKKKGKK